MTDLNDDIHNFIICAENIVNNHTDDVQQDNHEEDANKERTAHLVAVSKDSKSFCLPRAEKGKSKQRK